MAKDRARVWNLVVAEIGESCELVAFDEACEMSEVEVEMWRWELERAGEKGE